MGAVGGGRSQYVGVCPGENLPVFKIQRLESLLQLNHGMQNNSSSTCRVLLSVLEK